MTANPGFPGVATPPVPEVGPKRRGPTRSLFKQGDQKRELQIPAKPQGCLKCLKTLYRTRKE